MNHPTKELVVKFGVSKSTLASSLARLRRSGYMSTSGPGKGGTMEPGTQGNPGTIELTLEDYKILEAFFELRNGGFELSWADDKHWNPKVKAMFVDIKDNGWPTGWRCVIDFEPFISDGDGPEICTPKPTDLICWLELGIGFMVYGDAA